MRDSQTFPNRQPVSELQTYEKVLSQVSPREPIFLIRDGEDACVLLVDFQDYTENMDPLIYKQLMAAIEESEKGKRYSIEEVRQHFLSEYIDKITSSYGKKANSCKPKILLELPTSYLMRILSS